jgi:Zn-finger nucleic acid-binding protein
VGAGGDPPVATRTGWANVVEAAAGSWAIALRTTGAAQKWETLQRVDEQHEVATEHLLRIQRDPNLRLDFSRKRACPRCDGVKLKRHFFSAKKQVEVDHCPNCAGYWLDTGEWEKIRAEKENEASTSTVRCGTVTMETIRFVYQQRIQSRP